jgi:hypothetical protein
LHTAKGATHDKGFFAVQGSMAQGKGLGHGNTMRHFHGAFLFRALKSIFVVLCCFVVRFC